MSKNLEQVSHPTLLLATQQQWVLGAQIPRDRQLLAASSANLAGEK
jgi:hypothetical protein